ncbi:MAG: hypothetical protein GYA21_02670 [Myxococcales bacterium]|nr:hypothetical protein [Myxococcales bacterium]
MREALVACDMPAFSDLLARRQYLVDGLVKIDAETDPSSGVSASGDFEKISNKVNWLLVAGERLIASAEALRSDLLEKRRQNSVARTALRSYLAKTGGPINTRVLDG